MRLRKYTKLPRHYGSHFRPVPPSCDRERFFPYNYRVKKQEMVLEAQAEHIEKSKAAQERKEIEEARRLALAAAMRGKANEDFIDNARWALKVFPLLRKRLDASQIEGDPTKSTVEVFWLEWRNLELLKARYRSAPSLLAIGMLENMLTCPGGWESLLDKVQKAGGFERKNPENKEGDDDPDTPNDPEYAEQVEKLDNFGKT